MNNQKKAALAFLYAKLHFKIGRRSILDINMRIVYNYNFIVNNDRFNLIDLKHQKCLTGNRNSMFDPDTKSVVNLNIGENRLQAFDNQSRSFIKVSRTDNKITVYDSKSKEFSVYEIIE